MKRSISWLVWIRFGLAAALVALNWPILLATSPINLAMTEVNLPLGLLMLALAALPLTLCFVAHLHQQISTLMQSRGLLREVQRAYDLTEKVEASRVDGLRQLLTDQFRVINEHSDTLGAAQAAVVALPIKPTGLRQIPSGPCNG